MLGSKSLGIIKRYVQRIKANEQVFYKPGYEVFAQEMADLFGVVYAVRHSKAIAKKVTEKQLSFLLICASYDELERAKREKKPQWLKKLQGKRR